MFDYVARFTNEKFLELLGLNTVDMYEHLLELTDNAVAALHCHTAILNDQYEENDGYVFLYVS